MRTKLKNDEKIKLTTRQHWFPCFFTPLLITALLLLIAVGIESGKGFFFLLALIAACFATVRILQRQVNIWVVTNLRVIDEDGIFTHHAKESPLDKINNVSYTKGVLGRLFGYGNVMIQTAAGYGATTYYNVEDPELLKDMITTMQEDYNKSAVREQTQTLAGFVAKNQNPNLNVSVGSELEKIFELKQKGVLNEEEYNKLKTKILNS
jgi:uncharacterized membrane protein YdbT with pleckstrin-like domain